MNLRSTKTQELHGMPGAKLKYKNPRVVPGKDKMSAIKSEYLLFLVYILNETKGVELHMTPFFISLFACLFAISIGTLWEIFEFSMGQFFGFSMQKPMLDDPSGLTDTMWDMIVNAIGAFIISSMGWWYMKQKRTFFVRELIRRFIEKNPAIINKRGDQRWIAPYPWMLLPGSETEDPGIN